jgi:LemA protein
MGLTIFFGILIILILYIVLIYNNLVSLKHNVAKSWSNIDVLLKQRNEELPKLVEICRQYMKHEKEVLERVTQARSRIVDAQQSGDMAELGAAETLLRSGLGQLFVAVEAYPELKANEHFRHLQARVSGLENAISDRREYYNESVNNNNVRIEQFPDVIIASLFGFKPKELLEFTDTDLKDPDLKKLFS